jgi:GWxTD domain-containing protein
MKKFLLFLTSLILSINVAFALEVSVTHASFKGEKINYVEINYFLVGTTLTQVQIDSINSQGSIEITTIFKQNGQVSKFDKFLLKSPASLDPIDFYELRRYELDNGIYDLEVQFKDMNKVSNVATFKSMFILDFSALNLRQSDILILNSFKQDHSDNKFVRNGYLLEPLPFTIYDRTHKQLYLYNEVYNSDKFFNGDDFLMSYSIEKANNTANELPKAIGHQRKKSAPFIANMMSMDIANLESGNYRLVVTLRNRTNDLLSQKEVFFQRSNPSVEINMDTLSNDALQTQFVGEMDDLMLRFSLKSIAMNVSKEEAEGFKTMMSSDKKEDKQRYLFKYWYQKNKTLPEQAHDEYMMVAKAVDKTYNNGFGYGFETDRGRIFMQYGRPNDVVSVENEPNAPPYEVWIYYKFPATEQTNVKFLFYNPKLIPNGHQLLHSNCKGEMNNPRWKQDLYKNVPNDLIGNSTDGREVKSGLNRRADQIFNDN